MSELDERKSVTVAEVIEKCGLKNFTPEIDVENRYIITSEVNRPGMELAGYFRYFAENRPQLFGLVEKSYIEGMKLEDKLNVYTQLLVPSIPFVVWCRGFEPESVLLEYAQDRGIPVLGTEEATSSFMSQVIYYLSKKLAPCVTIHGVLMDVYGVGLLIIGESGIGKSEAALELIRRGHRLVADDVVEIRKVNDNTLRGTSPPTTRYMIELRGIGIVDVKTMFGVEGVKEEQDIDFAIKLEEWEKDREYDRLGMEDEHMDILGHELVCHSVPIRPGRNVAVICETAAINHRQKKMGYNAAKELYRRVRGQWEED